MHATITTASSFILAIVLVRLWENNNVVDLENHAMMKTVMWDFNSSYRRSLEEYYDKIDTDFNSIKHEVNKSYSTLHIDFNEWSENYNKCEKDIRKMTSIMSELITSYSQSAKNYSNKVEEMNERCKTLQIYLNNCTENFDKCENELRGYIEKDFKKFTNETLLKLDKIREVKDKKNECNKDVLWYSMILLGVGEVVVTIVLVSILRKLNALKRLPDNEVLSKKSTGRVTRQFDSDEKLRKAGSLRKSIAIIFFNDTRRTFYRDLMGDLTTGMETEYHSVSRNEDILQIKSKIAVFFVERNDRHIILESEHEIGDLKVSCVRYIQKNGGHVIVVYCGHKESDNIGDLLCSPSLSSADRHRELRALKDDNCFLSIHKTFSQTQKNHLKTKLKEYIDSK